MKAFKILGAGLMICACQPKPSSGLFGEGVALGKLDNRLNEVSGLVASRRNPNLFWAHNDSGHEADVYLINEKGNLLCTYELHAVKNRDWEDISLGPGPMPNEKYLYLADIGDNEARYPIKYVYRFPEPLFSDANKTVTIEEFDTIVVRLPVGAQDAEAFSIDPTTGDFYLFSKRLRENAVYRLLSSEVHPHDTLLFTQVSEVPYYNIVASDFSADGSELLLKTYNEVLYWKKAERETWPEAFTRPPIELKYKPEPQGESIAWAADGSGYYTTSEFRDNKAEPLIFYKRN